MTRSEYQIQLQASYDRSAPFGGNRAILAHLNKVKAMTEAEFEVHYAALTARANSPAVKAAVKTLAHSLAAKRGVK